MNRSISWFPHVQYYRPEELLPDLTSTPLLLLFLLVILTDSHRLSDSRCWASEENKHTVSPETCYPSMFCLCTHRPTTTSAPSRSWCCKASPLGVCLWSLREAVMMSPPDGRQDFSPSRSFQAKQMRSTHISWCSRLCRQIEHHSAQFKMWHRSLSPKASVSARLLI